MPFLSWMQPQTELFLVCEQQIVGDEGAEKKQRAYAVGQHMVEFKADPAAEVEEIKE